MKAFLVSLCQRLLHDLGLKRSNRRSFHLDETLTQSLQEMAVREQRSQDEVASDLLSFALVQHNIAGENLRRWQELSLRQQEVAALICLNYTTRQIAARLSVAPNTVKTHVRSVLYKFDVHNRTELRQALSDWDFSSWDRPKTSG